uniref:Laminin subunit alpha 1 n=1 Tax=Scleropages formosus TaxID=113540 RepID=A0A8C9SP23_SCLFO
MQKEGQSLFACRLQTDSPHSRLLLTSSLAGLFPAILNLASNAEISTNATCGESGPEMYCKLVEHVPGRRIRNPQCRICDSNSNNPKERHPVTNAIDGTNSWWQSPSIKNGRQFHWVTLTLDLRQVFQVAYVIIKAANSPRPGNWVLERSLDGTTFQPWQYYAISDTECLTRYNVTPRIGPPTYKKDDEVICTSYYSRLVPLEHGEIHTSLINGRPGADDLTPELLEFTSARYIRLRLQRIRTLNADLMTLSYRDPKDVDPIVTRRYYYSVKDISVGGMCICYGHAQSCPWDPVTKKMQCVCEHNTCGESCNECCPGYHQEPWQPGTLSDGNTCEKCNCHNKADDCYYNQTVAENKMSLNAQGHYVGGGVCLHCRENTAGVNCETCADGYFRPRAVSPYDDHPCVECMCDPSGSRSLSCVKGDDHCSSPSAGLRPGQCLCKEGFAGDRCDRCAFGYRDFPVCTRCTCSLEGSLNIDPCAECICKENVMGADCDLCKRGYYNLQGSNPEGCTECFCFGVSDVCESISWTAAQVPEGALFRHPSRDRATSGSDHLNASGAVGHRTPDLLYSWVAPKTFMGNKLSAYGGFLNYTVSFDASGETVHGSLLSQFDIIIEGNGRTLRHGPTRQLLLTPQKELRFAVEMLPRSFASQPGGRAAQRDELMTVLAHVSDLRVRARTDGSVEGALRLGTVSLDAADPDSASPDPARDVEQCECPWGYTGSSCENCISGFYRVGGILFGGNCLQCECNDHASECDVNGICLGCDHNTTGPHCDQCLPGFYGDPLAGAPDDCQRCACPLAVASNNFSPTCHLEGSGELICEQCEQGYAGARCERCANGYYGNPMVPGQGCRRCECNGNVDPLEPGHCDPVTGECLKCTGHSTGPRCERCQEGYYGDAVTAKNCRICGCHSNGSLSGTCDAETGQCDCKANAVGKKCDRCEVGYHGLRNGLDCMPCNCSPGGSTSEECDEEGRCRCVLGVAGDKCDRCQNGYYNFQNGGCTECDCAHTHGNCDSDSGECICPPHTTGEKCELCEEGHWGHNPVTGCKPCACSVQGSSSTQCDPMSGRCPCKPQFAGERCDRCAMGFKAFPECTACNCNVNGTREEYCNKKLGVCSCEEQGKCVCKDNVGGLGCDECKSGTFGLSEHNLSGCSPCFCSGVSSDCEELGGLVRVPMTLGADLKLLRVVSQSHLTGTQEGVFLQEPDVLLDISLVQDSSLAGPYYWRLPEWFQGNRMLSYGGNLRYTAVFHALDGSGLANNEPQVLLRGGRLRKVVIYLDWPAPENGVRTTQEIPLTEHKWKYFNSVSDEAVTHSDFMSVLSNIEYIIIKASYGSRMEQSRISNISMDTAVEADVAPAGGGVAHLIEVCDCPRGYAGLSCQECAPGYHRQPVSELNLRTQRFFTQPCVPCQCNNHSQACDLETGRCEGCQHNTTGDHCHLCAPGYYGKVEGSIRDCSLCECPRGNKNSFSPTCVPEGSNDFRCDACQAGYEGQYCERCSAGYYGNPTEPDGRCEPCRCSPSGSSNPRCDSLTGRCECKPGVTGHRCEECEERHVPQGGQCVSCDDKCTGVLLNDLDDLELSLSSVNLTSTILAPYSQLFSLENATREIKVRGLLTPPGGTGMYSMNSWLGRRSMEILQQVLNQLHGPKQVTNKLAKTMNATLWERHHQLQETRDLLSTAQARNNHTFSLLDTASSSACVTIPPLRRQHRQNRQSPVNVWPTQLLEQSRDELDLWNPTLRKQVDSLVMQMKKRQALELVYRAEDHAQVLIEKAQVLHSNLSGVRNISVNATSAVLANSNIQSSVEESWNLAKSANQTAASAFNLVRRILFFKTLNLFWLGTVCFIVSYSVSQSIFEGTRNITRQLSKSTQILRGLPNGDPPSCHPSIQMSSLHCLANVHDGATLSPKGNVHHVAEYSSRHEFLSLLRSYLPSFMSPTPPASAAEDKVREVEKRAEHLFDRLKPLKTLGESLSRNLSDIKELINQARKQAASIKVAVSADGDCVRAYQSEVTSSNFNMLSMTVKTSEPDNLLFYMGSSSSVDFLALEMRRGKVSFLWDVGSGHAKIEYPDIQINNNKWHQIQATRFGKQGTLTVQELKSDQKPVLKTATSPGTATVMDVNKSTRIFAGGLGGQIKKSPAVKLTRFKGCMGEVSLNGKDIGLWNYAERQGQCRGCFMSPQGEETSFHFDGSGYSVVEKALRSTATHIVMLFKTFSPNGLLLYLASNGTRDFLSIELVEGKVRLTFELGSGPLTLTSENTYNTGNWYKIALQRNKQKGYLAVMDAYVPSERETLEAESPGTASDLNRSDRDPIYIGGLPQSRPIRRQVVARSYVGCIKNLEIARTNFDLLKDAYGVRKGCVLEPIRSVTVLNEGFLELPPFTMAPQAEIMATFSTRNNTGIIMASFGTSVGRTRRQAFLALLLVAGRVEMHLAAGDGGGAHRAVIKSGSGTFGDGKEHSVILQRNRRIITVLVDEDKLDTVRLGSSSEKASIALGSLYIGGVPPEEGAGRLKATGSFYGCIKNIAVNMELLDLSRALRYQNVDMDSCLLEERPKRPVLPDDGEPEGEPCAAADQTESIPGAHQFGLSRHSHMALSINQQAVRKSFSIQLSVRTFASSGLLFYMANPNQVDYAVLQLRGGQLFLTCDLGKSSATATVPETVNDGHWHAVKADFGKKAVLVSVDGRSSGPVQASGKASTLDVQNLLYLGGLPPGYTARNIGNVTHSIAGCVKDVTLNAQPLETQSPVQKLATAPCFTQAQDGTFFNGTGFAAFVREGYKVRSDMAVALEFRATALDGVLLGISSAKVDAIGLELVNGQVLFHVNNGAGRISVALGPRSPGGFCDGRWHTLVANKNKHGLALTVDGSKAHAENPHPQSTSADTNDPVYIGGNAKQNCLTIRTPFQGCIRNLRLIKGHLADALDFAAAFELRGVLPHSCPGSAL